MRAPLFSCRVSFLGFFLGGIFSECGSFFFLIFSPHSQRLLWFRLFFEARNLQEHALCFSWNLAPSCSSARLILHTAEPIIVSGVYFCLVAEEFFEWRWPRVADATGLGGWNGEVKTVKHLLSRGHVTSIRSSSCRRLSQGVRGEIWNVSAINCQRQGSY